MTDHQIKQYEAEVQALTAEVRKLRKQNRTMKELADNGFREAAHESDHTGKMWAFRNALAAVKEAA